MLNLADLFASCAIIATMASLIALAAFFVRRLTTPPSGPDAADHADD